MQKIGLWYLYDFANSFASIVLIIYYPLILSEKGASNNWVGISASIATGILLLVLPYLGVYSDRTGKRIYIIRIASILMVISLVALAFLVSVSGLFSTPMLLIVSLFYILFQICFQGSYVFYSAMLRGITDTHNNAKVSGIGLGLGQLGNAVALIIIGPIIASAFILFGLSGKPLSFLIGALIFVVAAAPFLKQRDAKNDGEKVGFSYRGFIKRISSDKKIFSFLIGYSLLSDAILTFQLYLAIYIKRIFLFSDQLVSVVAIVGLIFTVIGGFMASRLANKLKNKERALIVSSFLYAVCFGLCAIMPRITFFVFAAIILSGLAYGLVFSLARAVYSEISPADNQGEFFSVFTVFERAASIVGPLVWLLTFYLLQTFGESIQYRGSVILLMLISLGGIYYLKKSRQVVRGENLIANT